MPLPKALRFLEDVVYEKLDDGILLLSLGTGFYYGLNGVGSRIWELLVATNNPESVLATLREEYDVDGEVLEQDLRNLIRDLAEKKLIAMGDLD